MICNQSQGSTSGIDSGWLKPIEGSVGAASQSVPSVGSAIIRSNVKYTFSSSGSTYILFIHSPCPFLNLFDIRRYVKLQLLCYGIGSIQLVFCKHIALLIESHGFFRVLESSRIFEIIPSFKTRGNTWLCRVISIIRNVIDLFTTFAGGYVKISRRKLTVAFRFIANFLAV